MTKVSEETKFQALHEQYKDISSEIKKETKLRNGLAIAIFIIVVVGVLFIFQPVVSINAVVEAVSASLDADFGIEVYALLLASIWIMFSPALTFLIIWYRRANLKIKSLQKHVRKVEGELHTYYKKSSVAFTKEKEQYLDNNSKKLTWEQFLLMASFLYILFFIAWGISYVIDPEIAYTWWESVLQKGFGFKYYPIFLVLSLAMAIYFVITEIKRMFQEWWEQKPPHKHL